MPRGDRTGPLGMGPMTGWGRGFCSGNRAAGFRGFGYGRGLGAFGRGRGMGPGRGFGPGYWWTAPGPVPQADELSSLKDEGQRLRDALEAVERRIQDLERASSGQEK